MLYNDAYAPALGDRHPDALGRRVPDVWVDVWADIKPMIDEVFAGGATYFEDLPLTMTRHGFDEECYFTFSYSPIVEPGGRVVGAAQHRRRDDPAGPGRAAAGSAPASSAACRARCTAARADAVRAALGVLGRAPGRLPVRRRLPARRRRRRPGWSPATASASRAAGRQRDPGAGARGDRHRRGSSTVDRPGRSGCPGLSAGGASPAGEVDVDTAVVLPLTVAGRVSPVGALVLGHEPAPAPGRRVPRLPRPGRRPGRRRRRRRAGGRDGASPRRRAGRPRPRAGAVLHRGRRHAAARRPGPDRRCPPASPSTTSRPPAPSRSAATGTTSSTCPTAGTASSSATWSAAGSPAAAVMGQLRSAGRALLLESRSPGARAVGAGPVRGARARGRRAARCSAPSSTPTPGTLRYSSAGHPPAIVVDADGALPIPRGRRLAAARRRRTTCRARRRDVVLPPGSTLLLYTDGLVERRDRGDRRRDGPGGRRPRPPAGTCRPAELADLLTERAARRRPGRRRRVPPVPQRELIPPPARALTSTFLCICRSRR